MKTVSAGFKTMLQTSQTLMVADLYTLTLLSGAVLYYTDAPQDIAFGGNTYTAARLPASITASATPFGDPDGVSSVFQLQGPDTSTVESGATVTAIHRTDWQGRQLLYPTARTNYLAHSQFDVVWDNTHQGVAASPIQTLNYGVAPDGTMTACRVQMSLNGGTTIGDYCYVYKGSFTMLANVPTTLGIWLKSNTASSYVLIFRDDGGGAQTVITVTPAWQWFSLVQTKTTTTSLVKLWLRGALGTSPSCDVSAWGGSATQGTAGGYIPTAASAVTVTDYTYTPDGQVTLGQVPAITATLDWDGTGSVGNTAPGFARGPTKTAIGLQVETLEVDILYDGDTRIMGTTPGAFANAGGFDGAKLKIDKFLTPSLTDTTRGIVNLFIGTVSDISAGSGKVTLNVSSGLIYLNAAFPRNYFMPQDNNALFDANTGISKAAWAVAGTTTSSTKTTITASGLTQPTDWFALGYVVITSGVNAGLTRSVKAFSGGVLTLLYPLPNPCAAGDTFTAYPGYDRTQAQATTKFSMLLRFRGFPYVPTPEVITLGQNGSAPSDNSGAGAGIGGVGRGIGGQKAKFLQQ